MNIDTIFTIKNEHLNRLDQNTAVEFCRKLLWAEARKNGVEISKINVSSWVNAPDGGVDATVDSDVQITRGSGIIKQGKTCYQIKSGTTFKPWQKSVIKEELFGTKDPGKQNLGESIQACLDAEGTYILVCTGIDPTESQRSEIISYIEEYLKQCGYSHPKFEVFTQNNLIGFLEVFPSLALTVKNLRSADFYTHGTWSQYPYLQVPFVRGPAQNELIQQIQSDMRRDDYPVHVRVWGEPGIGKTRLVLEATKTDDLSPLVIYYPTSSQFSAGVLMNEIRFNDNLSAIVVVDECDPDNRARIWHELRQYSPRIKLITIYNDYEEIPADIAYHVTPPLEHEQIRKIITQEYKIPLDQADRWVELCDGSPRVAHVIGWNLVNHPEDVLVPPATVNIWERYIAAGDVLQSEKTNQRRLILQYLALFKRFGYEGPVEDEAQAIAKMVNTANPQITWDRFQEIIYELRERKILQGEYTLYITPKALHIKLWSQWWERRSSVFQFETFRQDLTPKLLEWFYEMFQYAAESDAASRIVKELLGPNGPFENDDYLNTRLGSRFFSVLTEANPKYALRCLMRTIGTSDKATLLQFTEGRRYVVWALEKIAIWRELFADAARMLLALGEAENEGYSNNASGIFVELFSPVPGRVAPTEAPLSERLHILKEAFESDSKERRALALKACGTALTTEHFSRTTNVRFQGLRKPPDLWEPKTYGEWWDAYRQVWQLLSEQLVHLPQDEREKAVGILLGHAGSLGRIPDLGDMVVNTIRIITENGYASKKQIIETISKILFHDDSYIENKGLPPEIRQNFEQLRDALIGSDFHSLMQRYVGMDLVEDLLVEGRDGVDKIKPYLEKLAKQSIDNPGLLESELSWLVTTEAKNGNKFGYELGQRDDSFSLLPMLLDAQRNVEDNASTYFIGGYFHAIFDRDSSQWEQQLETLCADTTLNVLVPSITHYAGLTDLAGLRILKLAENGIISICEFGIFKYKNALTNLSENVFQTWIEFLLKNKDRSAIDITLKLFYNYYIYPKSEQTLPDELTFRLLSHSELFRESDNYRYDTMTDFYWTETAKVLLNLNAKKALELVKLMLVSFGSDKTIFDSFSQSCKFLTEATKRHPTEVWNYVINYLGNYDNFSRTISIANWLREADLSETEKEKGALTLIPRKIIWEWVEGDVENRAWFLASELVPKTLRIEEWKDSLARDILIRYGDHENVRNTLISNYSTEVFWGPASLHYENKIKKLVNIQNIDNEEKVNRWINEFVPFLKEQIEHAKIDEERRL